jgi:hypothetical protein
MIITKSIPYEKLKRQLDKKKNIGIVGCNACAGMSGTGDKKAMLYLRKKLEKDGFKIVDMDLIAVACCEDQIAREKYEGNVTIVLACDAGVYNIKKFSKKAIPGLITIGVGAWDMKGKHTLVKKF